MTTREAWQERVQQEKKELQEKFDKLLAFMDGEKFKELAYDEQQRLWYQRSAMQQYMDALDQRIEAFK